MKTIVRLAAALLAVVNLKVSVGEEVVLLDGVAAYVNEHVVTIGDVMPLIEPARRQLRAGFAGEDLRKRLRSAYAEALDTLIEQWIVLDAYEARGESLPDWVVERRANEIIRDVFDDDRAALMNELARNRITYEEWRDEMEHHIVMSAMRSANVERGITISPGLLREAYEEEIARFKIPANISIRMIVLNKRERHEDAATTRRRAEDVGSRLLAGESFAAIARELSDGSKAADGGDWGWVDPKMLRRELSVAAEGLRPSETSGVIETKEALYILRLEGRKKESVRDFADVQAEIERDLRRRHAELAYDEWIDRLREDAYVKVFEVDVF